MHNAALEVVWRLYRSDPWTLFAKPHNTESTCYRVLARKTYPQGSVCGVAEHVGDEDIGRLARVPPLQPCVHELPGTGERREPRNRSVESGVVVRGVEGTIAFTC